MILSRGVGACRKRVRRAEVADYMIVGRSIYEFARSAQGGGSDRRRGQIGEAQIGNIGHGQAYPDILFRSQRGRNVYISGVLSEALCNQKAEISMAYKKEGRTQYPRIGRRHFHKGLAKNSWVARNRQTTMVLVMIVLLHSSLGCISHTPFRSTTDSSYQASSDQHYHLRVMMMSCRYWPAPCVRTSLTIRSD